MVAPKSKAARTDGDVHQVAEDEVCHSDEPEVMVDDWEDSLQFLTQRMNTSQIKLKEKDPTGQQ